MKPKRPLLKDMVDLALKENWTFNGLECRNSDMALTIVIWQRWYGVSAHEGATVHLYRLLDLPSQDTVKRYRAVLQNVEHKYLPTDVSVLKSRHIAEDYWQEALGYRLSQNDRAIGRQTAKDFMRGDDRIKLV